MLWAMELGSKAGSVVRRPFDRHTDRGQGGGELSRCCKNGFDQLDGRTSNHSRGARDLGLRRIVGMGMPDCPLPGFLDLWAGAALPGSPTSER